VTHGVTDLSGNPLADFSSSFTTAAYATATQPQVSSISPFQYSNNNPANTKVTLTFNTAIDPTTISKGIFVSQNGVLVNGSLSMPTSTTVLFTPTAALAAGTTIQVFVTNAVTDTNGNAAQSYSASFTIAGTQALSLVRTTAVRGFLSPDSVLDIEFNAPLDSSTIDQGIALFHRGTEIGGVVTLRGDRTIRFVPIYAMTPDAGYELRISGTIRAAGGPAFRGHSLHFRVGPERSASPVLTATHMADTEIRLDFTAPINVLTANRDTLRLEDAAGAPIPFRIAFTPGDRSVVLYPERPGAARVSCDGLEDLVGRALACGGLQPAPR
jgi:hypothetical protein